MDNLAYTPKNAWSEESSNKIMDFSNGYKEFLNSSVTERKCFKNIEKVAIDAGFICAKSTNSVKPGDKIYFTNKNKNLVLAVIGEKPLTEGTNIIISHIDTPRLDLKPIPLYEDGDMAFFKTHYYGGIKKYQWTAIPLGLSGIVSTKNGDVEINIGDDEICLCVTDLLPHLAVEQMKKTMMEGIEGEKLNLLVGSIPSDCENSKFKQTVLEILNKNYGICEEDFISAELEAYPLLKSRDIGLDKSMVGGFGQDDRICSYTSLKAIFDLDKTPEKTALCVLVDKEETGSSGNTGIKSLFFENTIAELINMQCDNYSDLFTRRCLSNSSCLSADVAAAYDPSFDFAYERKNSCYLGKGLAIIKYTGSRGKGGTSDASAEFMGKIRRIFNDNNVIWQTGELGKVDGGGGGTVAQYLANLNIDVVDCGVALLSMHAPYEVSSKADIYYAYKGYKAFYEEA